MRISDWSSDVCSSDLNDVYAALAAQARRQIEARKLTLEGVAPASGIARPRLDDILDGRARDVSLRELARSEEHTSELQSLMRISYAVFCLTKKKTHKQK